MSVVVRRYAQALFSLSKDAGVIKNSEGEAHRLLSWIKESPDFKIFTEDRLLKLKDVQEVLVTLSKKASLSSIMSSFLLVLAEKSRLYILKGCLKTFLGLVDEENNLLRGYVTTVDKLPEANLTQIKHLLSQKLDKDIELTPLIDQKILGGVVLKVGPYLIDSSLESRLLRLEARLKG